MTDLAHEIKYSTKLSKIFARYVVSQKFCERGRERIWGRDKMAVHVQTFKYSLAAAERNFSANFFYILGTH